MPMLSKCANPSCSNRLVYLREGKIFMMEAAPSQTGPAAPKTSNRIEHFWLCGTCSAEMTLAYDRQQGVKVVPKRFPIFRAAAS
ncbi:MAG TPA: hypothetical protein VFP71_02825 [Candidatus Angelobacter sp.]|nr:hypothetical protein [Candidatus Angelobacter sp.]